MALFTCRGPLSASDTPARQRFHHHLAPPPTTDSQTFTQCRKIGGSQITGLEFIMSFTNKENFIRYSTNLKEDGS